MLQEGDDKMGAEARADKTEKGTKMDVSELRRGNGKKGNAGRLHAHFGGEEKEKQRIKKKMNQCYEEDGQGGLRQDLWARPCVSYSGLLVVSLDEESFFSGQDVRLRRECVTGTEQRAHSPQMPSEAVLEG